jgi:hypothetical protein
METVDVIRVSVLGKKLRTRCSAVVEKVVFPEILRQANTQLVLHALYVQLRKR